MQKRLLFFLLTTAMAVAASGQVIRPFQPRSSQYSPDKSTYTIKGDFTVLGNTNLILQPYTNAYGNNNNGKVGNTIRPMRYVDIDGDASTVNSSSAQLVFPEENGCNPACTEVVYAGLYWMSRGEPVLYGNNIMVNNQIVDGKFEVSQNIDGNYNVYTIKRLSNNTVVRQIRVRTDSDNQLAVETRNTNSGSWASHSGINSANYKIYYAANTSSVNDRRWWPGHDGSHNNAAFNFSAGGVTYYIYGISRYYGLYITKGTGTEYTVKGHTMYQNKIKFKHQSESAYTTVTATTSELMYPTTDSSWNGNYFINVGYAEVTDYVREHGEGNYFGADIALTEGPDFQVGYCGGWGLVVVYQNEDMKWRNITLFDGYALTNADHHPLINIEGFEANPAGDVAVKVAMMTAEGDRGMPGDRCRMLRANQNQITDNPNTYFELSLPQNQNTTDNFFNGSIYTGGNARNPNYTNNCGIDISMMTLDNSNKQYIRNGQTKTQFRFSCVPTDEGVADIYVPWFFGISIQCYVPEPEAFNAFMEVEGAHFDETENAYVVRPGDSISFLIDIRNRGTESVRDAVIRVPIPKTASLAAPHSFAFMAPERSGSTEFDATAGSNGTAIWHLDKIPAGYPDSVYATLRLDFVLTEDCYELMSSNEECKLELMVDGTLTAIGVLSGVPVEATSFVVGYQGGGQCKGELVRHPIRVLLDRQAYLDEGNCTGDYSVRVLRLCTEPSAPNTIDFMDVYTNYPSGTRFFNSYPITESTVEYTISTGFPLPSSGVLNAIAVTNAANAACYTNVQLRKTTEMETPPTVTPGESTIHYCVNETAQPLSTHVTATTGYTLYFYRTLDGAAETDIVPSTEEPGTYTYYVRQGTENCISDPVTITVIVHSPATLSASITGSDVCAGNGFTVTATGASGTYSWNSEYDGYASQSGKVLTISPSAPAGNLTVTYTVTATSEYCASGASVSKDFTIYPATVAGHIVPPATELCKNGTFEDLMLVDYVGEVERWQYRTGTSGSWTNIYNTTDRLSSDMINTITATTQFRARVKSGPCSAIYTDPVTVTPTNTVAPSAPTMPTPQYACPNTTYTIAIGSNNAARLKWYATASAGSSDPNLRTVEMGTSYVTRYVSAVDASGVCESKRTLVSVRPKFNSGSIIGGKTVTCIGGDAPTIQNSVSAESLSSDVTVTYAWTVTPEGGTETPISGASGASYAVPNSYMATEGSYTFKRYAQGTGCPDEPSVGEYKLTVVDCDAEYTEAMCPLDGDYYFAPFDTTFKVGTVTGDYIHHGSKVVEGVTIDTTALYHLTIWDEYENNDQEDICLYEDTYSKAYSKDSRVTISINSTGVTVTSSSTDVVIETVDAANGDFLLKMKTIHGCDSIVNLHVDYNVVQRDTVYGDTLHVTGQDYDKIFANHTFHVTESGVMTFIDTVTGSNGCDSITVRYLIVEEPHEETICDSTFNSSNVWEDNVGGYCWEANGKSNCIAGKTVNSLGYYEFPGERTINGTKVDTVSYLKLNINLSSRDTVDESLCLYETTETYDYTVNGETFTFTVTEGTVTAPSSTTEVEVITIDANKGEFVFKMKTKDGCDSIIVINIDRRVVQRDTVYKDTLYAGTTYTTEFANKEFTVDHAGTYTIIDTVPGSNGCDSITTRVLIVEEPHEDTICDSTFNSSNVWEDNVGGYCWEANGKSNCIAGKTVNSLGYYEFPGERTINGTKVDTVSYLKLNINLSSRDTVDESLCLYETTETYDYTVNGETFTFTVTEGTVTAPSSTTEVEVITIDADQGQFVFKMKTKDGCDSVIVLNIERRVVQRDTVYKDTLYAGTTYTTEFANKEFTVDHAGIYTIIDTVPGSNGCDSITTRVLIVETLHKDTICQVEFATYTWRGNTLPASTDSYGYYEFPGKRTINGTEVDTVSYLLLTVNPNPVVDVTSLTDLCPNVGFGALQATVTSATKADYQYVWTGDLTAIPVTITTSALTAESVMTIPAAPASCGQTYHETVTVTDANGCTATATATISVKSPATPTIAAKTGIHDDNLGCNPTTIVLTYNDFTVTDECNATAQAVVTPSSVAETGCGRRQTWTASYTNACNVSATPVTITYTWTVDHTVPTIALKAGSEANNHDWGCNPTVVAPEFTVSDNCAGDIDLPTDSVTVGAVVNTSTCGRSQTWTARYTDPCGNKATNLSITYQWTEDKTVPTIVLKTGSEADGHNWGCNPTVVAPNFTVSDNCAGDIDLPTDSIIDGGVINTSTCGRSQTWTAHYTDPCGNKATNLSITYQWTEDKTVPTIALKTGSEANNHDWGCNPTVVAPEFTVSDNCAGDIDLPTDSVTVGSVVNTSTCGRSQTWTARYTDPCGNKATNLSITYYWTEDKTVPTIVLKTGSEADGHNWGCNPTVVAPNFTVSDNCAGDIDLPTDSIIDGGVINTSTCGRSQTWTAHYTDPCKNKAADVSVTYYWTEDKTAPVIHTEAVSDHKGCNPTIMPPTFTVTDNCEGTFVLPAANVTTTGKTGTGCEKSQSWTANYTDGCGNPATPLTVTYYWKEDTQKPVIATTATSSYLGCDPTTITPPVFTVSDNCEGDFTLPTDSVTDGGRVAVTGEPYKFSRTWTAHYTDPCKNKADDVSITYTWVESPSVSISCPPDVNKTLAYGDCVMNIYPAEIGTPTINAPSDWPMTVSNNIPADNLYYEGETEITWVATDDICGYSTSCKQKVIVVFPQCPDAVDCEGNVYHGVRIDCECWTQTNLISNCYGDANECVITGNCDDPIPCVYEYETPMHPDVDANVAIFGKLYCDSAALKDSVINSHGHIQGICPEGWYLPTPEQYESLNLHGADALKSPLYWTDGGGSNTTEFTWLPAGWYNGALQRFEGLLSEGYFWSTEVVSGEVKIVAYLIHHDCDSVIRVEAHTGLGYSVRCIKEKD